MRNIWVAFLLLSFCSPLVAQQALNNESVIKLVKAGISDDLIISTISASEGTFDTSVDGIIALKAGGASDKVVSTIVSKSATASSTASLRPQVAQDPNDPMSQHEPGIYLMNAGPDGSRRLILLKPVAPKVKESNSFGAAMTMNISSVKFTAEKARCSSTGTSTC